ncbi:MAG: EAL domain-containing protein [Rhizobium sp.]|nr:EAL domain-containing protein [Rhizobium sp.]MBX9456350.1 EAL domain-containing protein [Rhizobium sp.]
MNSIAARRFFRWVAGLFAIPRDNPVLTIAQYEAFSKQVPLMYAILLTNMVALAFTHAAVAPSWLVYYLPGLMGGVSLLRTFSWLKSRHTKVEAAEAYRKLRATNIVVGPITVAFTAWALLLLPYGDAFQRSHVVFFMAITVIGCIFCLMHLRSAALAVTVIVNVPLLVTMLMTGEPTFIAMGINVILVTIAMIAILMTHYRDFRGLNESRQALLDQQQALNDRNAAIQALSDENLRLANLDSLTVLQNRRSFFLSLEDRFASARSAGEPLAIGIVDLDGFKPVNDMYGHAAGDKVLVEIAARLERLAARRQPDGRLAIFRMGGDEFGLVLSRPEWACEAIAIGHEICDAICEPINIGSGSVQVTGSIGFAIYPDVGTDGQTLYERADYALYTAKRNHRAGVVVFNAEQADELSRQRIVEDAMAAADLKRELSLVYQPIVHAATGRCVAFEALARWDSPVIGKVSPGEFVPVAEHTGRIGMITRLLLEQALETAKAWPRSVRLSFNLSAHDLVSAEGMLRIVAIVEASGMDPSRIVFEITETAVMQDFEQARASVEMLRRMGCGIALDDFGTGYSSLHHIHKLPLTKIKIDGSFVRDIQRQKTSYNIVKSLLALCADMGLNTVVEGVETSGELAVLRGLGAELVQGYYFSRPLPAAAAIDFIAVSESGACRLQA